MRWVSTWPFINFPVPASGRKPWLYYFHHLAVFFSNVRTSLKSFLKKVESVLSGRSAALQRRLIVLPSNSHLIVPLSKTPWLCRQQAPLLLSRACLDKWFHNSFIPHLPYELIVPQGCMESVNVVSNVTIVCNFQDMSNNCPSEGCLLLQAPAAFLCHVQVVKAVSQNNYFQ